MKLVNKFIAIDQYGNIVWIKESPRKELLEYHNATKAAKLYRDDKQGNSYHVGYYIDEQWYEIFKVEPWAKKV